tara:strand:+ start:1413 stop:1922 length:510 start_codon:yes stop_codon:yes gene_type:complete
MNYNIKTELLIRKKLETITPYNIEFNQNYKDKFGYDLKCYKHIETSDQVGYKKKFMCYIEVEYGKTWIEKEIPKNWEISFLQRKIKKFNYNTKSYENELKENGHRTIYLKTNTELTNCYFNKIDFIFRNGKNSCRNKQGRSNSFLVLPRSQVSFGWETFSNYILNYCNI